MLDQYVLLHSQINGKDTKELMSLTDRFESLRLNLIENTKNFSQLMTRNNPTFDTLYASKIVGKCASGCKINSLNTSIKYPLLDKLARPNSPNRNLFFEDVSTQSIGNFPCPKPAVSLKHVTVSGTLNGIPFEMLRENLLTVTGDQDITGKFDGQNNGVNSGRRTKNSSIISGTHIYENLSVSSANIPLEIATHSTQQSLHMKYLKANNLYLKKGGILLPLEGQPVAINEPMTASKVKVTSLIHLNGKLSGEGVDNLKPMTWIPNPLILRGDYFLQKVMVEDQTNASDLSLDSHRSLTRIMNEAVRLDESVPVHLKLSKAKTVRLEALYSIIH